MSGRDVRITRENLLSIVMQRRSCVPSRGLLRNSAVASLPVVQVLPRSHQVRFRSRRIALTQNPKPRGCSEALNFHTTRFPLPTPPREISIEVCTFKNFRGGGIKFFSKG